MRAPVVRASLHLLGVGLCRWCIFPGFLSTNMPFLAPGFLCGMVVEVVLDVVLVVDIDFPDLCVWVIFLSPLRDLLPYSDSAILWLWCSHTPCPQNGTSHTHRTGMRAWRRSYCPICQCHVGHWQQWEYFLTAIMLMTWSLVGQGQGLLFSSIIHQ